MDYQRYTDKIDKMFESCEMEKHNLEKYKEQWRTQARNFVEFHERTLCEPISRDGLLDNDEFLTIEFDLKRTEKILKHDESSFEKFVDIGLWFNQKSYQAFQNCWHKMHGTFEMYFKDQLAEKKNVLKGFKTDFQEMSNNKINYMKARDELLELKNMRKKLTDMGINVSEANLLLDEKIKIAEENVKIAEEKISATDLYEEKYLIMKEIMYLENKLDDFLHGNENIVPGKFVMEFNSMLNSIFPCKYLADYIIHKFKNDDNSRKLVMKDPIPERDCRPDDFSLHIQTVILECKPWNTSNI